MAKPDDLKFALPNHLAVATAARRAFTLKVPDDVTIEDVLEPAYLSTCLSQFQDWPLSRIEVCASTWWAELLVVAVNRDRKETYCKVIHKPVSLSYDPTAGAKNFNVEKGAAGRHNVRLNKKLIKDFATKAEADAWVANQVAA